MAAMLWASLAASTLHAQVPEPTIELPPLIPTVSTTIPEPPPLRATRSVKTPALLFGEEPSDAMPPAPELAPKKLDLVAPPLNLKTTEPTTPTATPVDRSAPISTRSPFQHFFAYTQASEPAVAIPSTSPAVAPIAAATGGCAGCGRFHGLGPRWSHGAGDSDAGGGCAACGAGWSCAPGHRPCYPCESDSKCGQFFCDFYHCICCPDPCYDPQWIPQANAAFFVDGARPTTQTELRWNGGVNGNYPDRSEYLWARADGKGRGPRPPTGKIGENEVGFNDFVLSTEVSMGKFGTVIDMPYRSVDPEVYNHGSGFGDMSIATKTLLLDCELLLVAFEMRTYLPIGNVTKGVGNGHVSLEPSLIFALKCTNDTYLQAQFAEWIPIGGDPSYAGSIFHTHFAINHVLCRWVPDVPLIATLETQTWSFQDGQYTDPVRGAYQKSSDETYFSAGPGLRLFICDKMDFGFGTNFALSHDHFAREYYRFSFRARF